MKTLKTPIYLVIILLVTSLLINGCKPDEDVTPPEDFNGAQVLIANQGNFGWGEGTLSVYYEDSKTVDNEVFKRENGSSLGNVFQSISKVKDNYYFVINNSGRLVVMDTNFKEEKRVDDFTSPRYFYQTDENTGYMTDLYSKHIYLVDLESSSSVATLDNGHWSEQAVILDGTFWYTAPATNKIFSLDLDSDLYGDSIEVGEQPESIVKDKNGSLWVLCKGDASKNQSARLAQVASTGPSPVVVSQTIEGVPTSLAYDIASHTLYFIVDDGVYRLRLDIDTAAVRWKDLPGAALYELAVNPMNGDVYVSDVKDFVSKSTIYRFAQDGTLLDEFSAGIIAGDFFFP